MLDLTQLLNLNMMVSQPCGLTKFCVGSLAIPSKGLAEKSRERLWNDAIYTIRELVSACRHVADDLTLEDGDTCTVDVLATKMFQVPKFITT